MYTGTVEVSHTSEGTEFKQIGTINLDGTSFDTAVDNAVDYLCFSQQLTDMVPEVEDLELTLNFSGEQVDGYYSDAEYTQIIVTVNVEEV